MGKEGRIYVCDVCQQIVEVKKSGTGTLVCCNLPMRLYEDD
ncbi:MAG: desulfoferrodoxin FeS4 iron-binding domain-containing protein [Candidatus Thorarchaeota archaeon]